MTHGRPQGNDRDDRFRKRNHDGHEISQISATIKLGRLP